jgi:tRNA threonylcarbamoyladenosine biosynthesis protein TsaB
MHILALDTATEACSAAILVDDELTERFEVAPRRHTELILPMIGEVLAHAAIDITRLDAIAFGRGPGSFTGIRIAAGVVQGIAFAADLPVIPVSTLAAIAADAIQRQNIDKVAVAIDARINEVYWALYQADTLSIVRPLTAESVGAVEQVPLSDTNKNDRWHGAGSGWSVYADRLNTRLPVISYKADCYPSAAAIARLAAIAWKRGETVSAEQALPVYLRDRVTV